MIEFAVSGVDIVPGKAVWVSIVCHATLHPDYVRARAYDDNDEGLSVAAHVDQIVRETIVSGLGTHYADGSGHPIWLDPDYEWEAGYSEDDDHWIARGNGS